MFTKVKEAFALLFIFTASMLGAAEYNAIVLGDIHFDALSYHCTPDNKLQIRLNKVYSNMWKEQAPAMLSCAAELLNPQTAFVIQAGDFTNGYGITPELQEKMLSDAFIKVKSFFPKHRLLPIKGNHDVAYYLAGIENGKTVYTRFNSGAPAAKAFLPRIANELGRESITGNYSVTFNNDLYIFYDSTIKDDSGLKFLRNTLKENPQVRYVFFITHHPVLPCSTGVPGWLVPKYNKIIPMLFERNAIIISAHTHQPSLVKVSDGKNTLTQLTVSSIAYRWNNGKKAGIKAADFAEYLKLIAPEKLQDKKNAKAIKDLQALQIDLFEMYANATGITVLKVGSNQLSVEIYSDVSGKPTLVKQLK
jgi:hypothetical protein